MTAPVLEGQVLAGKYRIERVLGSGGMGIVVAAHHIQLDHLVALKFLLPAAAENEETVARFAREAHAAVKIKSEHVARVVDVGTLETGAPFMVMEYLDGVDLSAWLRQKGALSIELAVELVLQASEAIAEAHGLGIVHRDLKPANLFVIRRPDGSLFVKVLDFGISKIAGRGLGGADMTQTSAVMGSPLYMSPEQVQSSKNTDARSDIWSLGVILHELITGNLPFHAESLPALIHRVLTAEPERLRDSVPSAPVALENVVLKCLEKDREKRFRDVGELAVALVPFAPRRSWISVERISGVLSAAGLSGTAVAMPPSSYAPQPKRDATDASWGRTESHPARGGKALLAGGLATAAILATIFAMRPHKDDPAARPKADVASSAATNPVATIAATPSGGVTLPRDSASSAPASAPIATIEVTPTPPTTQDKLARAAAESRPSPARPVARRKPSAAPSSTAPAGQSPTPSPIAPEVTSPRPHTTTAPNTGWGGRL